MAIGIEIFDLSFDEWLEKNRFGTFKEQSDRFAELKKYLSSFKLDYSMPNLDKFVYKVTQWLKESDESLGRVTWKFMLENSTVETIAHLKKSIRIFEKVGVIKFQGDYISKFKLSATEIQIEIDSIKKLIANMEYVVHGELETIPEPEPDPITFNSQIQEIGWLFELGIVKQILDNCEGYGQISKAANIIHSFTKHIKPETIRRCLEAINTPNENNKKNHPFTNTKNKTFVNNLAISLEWNKIE